MPRPSTTRSTRVRPGAHGVEVKPARRCSSGAPPLTAEDRLRQAFGAGFDWITEAPARAARRIGRRRASARRVNVRLWRAVIGVTMALAAVLTLAALGVLALAGAQPRWWVETGIAPNDAPRLAAEVELGVGNALHRGRPDGEPWTVGVTQDEANAWIVDRLPRWLANQGVRNAEKLPEVRVAFADGAILLGFKPRGQERTATLTVSPRVEDEQLWTPATALKIGRMPLPSDMLRERGLEYVPEPYRSDAGTQLVAATLAGEIPAPSTVELADGRIVRVVDLSVEEGRLLVTCVTVRE